MMRDEDPHRAEAHDPRAALVHLTERELALRWRVSPRTLERWRITRIGPCWLRLNGRVRYRLTDVLTFEQLQLRRAAP